MSDRYLPQTPREKRMRVIAATAGRHGMTVGDIMSRDVSVAACDARARCIAAVRAAFPQDSYSKLGVLFGRDRTSIVRALKRARSIDSE